MSDSPNEKIITVGRSSANHIVLDNPNVSSSHAKFIIKDNTVTLEDTGSTNGSYVNGEKIISKVVTNHDRINFGRNYKFEWSKLEPFIKMVSGEVSHGSLVRLFLGAAARSVGLHHANEQHLRGGS